MRFFGINFSIGSTNPADSFVRRHPGLVLYLLITLLVISLSLEKSSMFEKYEVKIQDAMFTFRGEQPVGNEVVLLNIDDKSLDYLGLWPWSHHLLAQMIEALDYYKPATIYLDFPLDNRVEDFVSGNSQLLAENILQSGNVILPFGAILASRTPSTRTAPEWLKRSALQNTGVIPIDQVEMASRIDLPEEMFGQAAKYLGVSVTYFDKDNGVRRQPLIIKYENKYYPAAELLLSALYLGVKPGEIIYAPGKSIQVGNKIIPVDNAGKMLLNFRGKNVRFVSHSVKDLWQGTIPVDDLANKLVIINLAASGHYDLLKTPISDEYAPAFLSATMIDNIVKGSFINSFKASINPEILVILGIGLFCAFLLPRVSLIYRFVILLVFLFALINLNFILFSSFSMLAGTFYPALEIILFAVTAPLMKSSGEKRKKDLSDPARTKARASQGFRSSSGERASEAATPTAVLTSVARPGSTDATPPQKSDRGDEAALATKELSGFEHSVINADEPIYQQQDNSGLPENAATTLNQTPEAAHDEGRITFDEAGRPSQFGRYKILEVIGQGAMGTVYKGLDPAIGRPVALKTIRLDRLADSSEIDELRERFMLEAKAAGSFSHPNIVVIYDVGQEKNIQYIAMEYLEGHTLDQIIKRKLDLNFRIVAKIITQVCGALTYAHERHVIHRDIKPANIMVLDNFKIKVMDFGIAHIESSDMTKTGIAMGTPNYISPEQLGGKEVTKSSDIFSLGVVMYELLTGAKPFRGENISNLIMNILNHNPEPPSKIVEKVPPLLDHVVMKALNKDPLQRYHSAEEMSAAMEDFVSSFAPKAIRY